jgi:hypothetical protein
MLRCCSLLLPLLLPLLLLADDCSGIDADCLNADLQSNAAGTVCRPLLEGAPCGNNQRCMSGVCGGTASAHLTHSLAATSSRFNNCAMHCSCYL